LSAAVSVAGLFGSGVLSPAVSTASLFKDVVSSAAVSAVPLFGSGALSVEFWRPAFLEAVFRLPQF
jgi:hypothetical protein